MKTKKIIKNSVYAMSQAWRIKMDIRSAILYIPPKGEATSHRFVHPSVPVLCLANNFKTTETIEIELDI